MQQPTTEVQAQYPVYEPDSTIWLTTKPYLSNLADRYDIYVMCTDDKPVKTFDQWLNS